MNVVIIKLGCVGCGASLDIPSEVDRLACAHCGTQQLVQRDGGTIHLKEFADTLSRVRIGTDKTAAELAISRLTKEQESLVNRRQQAQQEFQLRYDQSANSWRLLIQERETTVTIVTVVAGFLGLILTGFLGSLINVVIDSLIGSVDHVTVVILLGFVMAPGFAILGYLLTQRTDKYNSDKLRKLQNHQLALQKTQASVAHSRLDSQIRALAVQISKNRNIADS